MLAAVKGEDGEALLNLYTEALADFEHNRVTILNPALLARPRAMLLEGPPSGPPELDDGGDDLVDQVLKEIDLLEGESVPDPQPSRTLTAAKTKPSAAGVNAKSKFGKRLIKLRVAPPSKRGPLKPR